MLDVGCGKGEFLLRLNKRYDVSDIGIDKSPYCAKDVEKNEADRESVIKASEKGVNDTNARA